MAPSSWFVRAFARMLPQEFRERVFEPAWADVVLDEQASGGGTTRARWILVLECLRLGLPQHVWHHGRPTRLARGSATAILVIAAVLMLLMRVAYRAQAAQ